MTFRDTAELDLDEVFFDLDEFAEEHCVDGRKTTIVMDNEKVKEFDVKLFRPGDSRGLYEAKLAFYVRGDQLEFLPEPGGFLYLDGQQYRIADVEEQGGIYSIVLGVILSE